MALIRPDPTLYSPPVMAMQAPNPPQGFTRARAHRTITGEDVSAQSVEDAIQLAEEKYCSVGAMVKLSAELRTTSEIVPATPRALVGA